ncbi:MAG: glycosyltransferase family 2 protein, partial [Gemmataceae bacterium]
SRYLRDFRQDTPAPTDRRFINRTITEELNSQFGLSITDAFCGFKAYRVTALRNLHSTETGWGMPLELWVQAAQQQLKIVEIGVPRLYLDPTRAFGGVLNDATERLSYYRGVIAKAAQSATVCHAPQSVCSELV